MIRRAVVSDNHYIVNTAISFEESEISLDEMKSRIKNINENCEWIVFEFEKKIIGYAYSSQWKERLAYRYTLEVTVYIDKDHLGKDTGSKLMEKIIWICKEKNVHSLIGIIALPNDASIKLFEKFGFVKRAHFKETGYKFEKWIDTGYWQKML